MIRELILDLKNQGQTVFLNTHNMEVASQLCDRVAFIVDGQIAALDSPRNFMHLHGKPLVKVGWGPAADPQTAEFPLSGLAQNREFLAALDRDDLRSPPLPGSHPG
jgi:fluoroquinolone transport system ATP-binding protein